MSARFDDLVKQHASVISLEVSERGARVMLNTETRAEALIQILAGISGDEPHLDDVDIAVAQMANACTIYRQWRKAQEQIVGPVERLEDPQ